MAHSYPAQTVLIARQSSPHNLSVRPCHTITTQRCKRCLPQAQQGAVQPVKQELKDRPPPWSFGFQTNERYLQWDTSAQRQLLKLHVAKKLDTDVEWVEDRLRQVADILPDLSGRLDNMKADIVIQLVSDVQAVAQRLVDLRAALPGINISTLIAKHPFLLFQLQPDQVEQQMKALRKAFEGLEVEDLIRREPLMLTVKIDAVFNEVKRLLPKQDPAQYVHFNPTIVLSMEEHLMDSTIDGDLTQ